jgi:hypothetical protein
MDMNDWANWYHNIRSNLELLQLQKSKVARVTSNDKDKSAPPTTIPEGKNYSFADSIMPQSLIRICRHFYELLVGRIFALTRSMRASRDAPSFGRRPLCTTLVSTNAIPERTSYSTKPSFQLFGCPSVGIYQSQTTRQNLYRIYSLSFGSSCAGKRSPPHIDQAETAVTSPANTVHHKYPLKEERDDRVEVYPARDSRVVSLVLE